MVYKCPDCSGIVIRKNFEVVCKSCGLVVNEPICIWAFPVFE